MEAKKKHIIDFFANLDFNAERHQYKYKHKHLSSVSSKIKNYVKPFDAKTIAGYVAIKRQVPIETILGEWEDLKNIACDKGNRVHLFGENYPLNRTLQPTDGHEEAVVAYWDSLPRHIVPCFFELQMFSEKMGLAGTADIILYNTLTKKFIVADYKGLPLDTKILTSKGWSTMGEIKRGEKVFDKNGKLCTIKHTSGIKNKKCYKITFDNKEEIISDFEHRWEVSFKNGGKLKNVVMTTEEIKKHFDKGIKNSYKLMRIYNPKPLQNKIKKLLIDPYLLGMWLGDGHSVDTKITQMNPLVWKELEKRGYSLGPDISGGGAGMAQTRTVYNNSKIFKKLNLLGNKHIPVEYLLSSEEQRLDLLRGFMDADGYYNKIRKRYVMATTKRSQVDFFLPLLGSLGIKPTVIEATKYCNGKTFQGWDVTFTTLINPFLCRNQDINFKTNNEHKYRRIVNVEETKSIPTRCIEVNSDSHTFLYGETFIKTHNTNKDIFKNYRKQKMLIPFNNLLDSPYNKYQVQLSIYQYLFEQTGFEVEDRVLIWLLPDGTFKTYNTEHVAKGTIFN